MNANLAVVVPCFNRGHLAIETLNTVCQQSLLPQHLIIVDDCSSDGSVDIINDWIKQQKGASFEITFVCQRENRGVSVARNIGLKIAVANDYEFIYFLDSDDQPRKDFIQKAISKLKEDRSLVAVTADREMVYDSTTITLYHFPIKYNPWKWFLTTGAGIASCTVFRTEAIKQLGGFSVTLRTGQDVDLFIRVACLGDWGYIPNYPVRMSAQSNSKHIKDYYDNYLLKWAMIYEFSFTTSDIKKYLAEEDRYRYLGYRWFEAGIQALKNKDLRQTYQCLVRSLIWRVPGTTKRNLKFIISQIRIKLSETFASYWDRLQMKFKHE